MKNLSSFIFPSPDRRKNYTATLKLVKDDVADAKKRAYITAKRWQPRIARIKAPNRSSHNPKHLNITNFINNKCAESIPTATSHNIDKDHFTRQRINLPQFFIFLSVEQKMTQNDIEIFLANSHLREFSS